MVQVQCMPVLVTTLPVEEVVLVKLEQPRPILHQVEVEVVTVNKKAMILI